MLQTVLVKLFVPLVQVEAADVYKLYEPEGFRADLEICCRRY